MGLSFKQGDYTNLTSSKQIKTGDICFAYLDANKTNMTICIKNDNGFSYLMPYPGDNTNTFGKALISQGGSTSPAYATLSISGGGTGAVSLNANRLLYVNSTYFSAANHYIDNTSLHINKNTVITLIGYAKTISFGVNGHSVFNGNLYGNKIKKEYTDEDSKKYSNTLSQYNLHGWKEIEAETFVANSGQLYSYNATDKAVYTHLTKETGRNMKDSLTGFRVRMDTRLPQGLAGIWCPPKACLSNQETAVISFNRYSNTSNITQIGLTGKGLFFRQTYAQSFENLYNTPWYRIVYADAVNGEGKCVPIGSGTQFIYLNADGKINTSTASVGGQTYPVYLNGGVITKCRASAEIATFTHDTIDVSGNKVTKNYTNVPYYWDIVPHVGDDGVMEVGKYIDFHETPHDNDSKYSDYSTRIVALATTTKNEVNLPAVSGQLIVRPSIGTAVGGPLQPVYINADGQTVVCNYFNMNDSGNYWNIVPHVDDKGVMEIGEYLDFHSYSTKSGNTSHWDYSTRIVSQQHTNTRNILYLPSNETGMVVIAPATQVKDKNQWTTGVGSVNKPVYINTDGVVKEITALGTNIQAHIWPNTDPTPTLPKLDDDAAYKIDCQKDGIIRFDSHIDKCNTTTISAKNQDGTSILTNNANALITINRHPQSTPTDNYYTKLAFTEYGYYYQIGIGHWRALAFIETDAENKFMPIGSTSQPIYIGQSGKIKACNIISAQYGGTGSAITDDSFKYFIPYFNNNNCLKPSKYYIDGDGWLFGKNDGDNGIGVAWRWGSATDLGGCNGWLYLGSNMTTKTRGLYDAGGAGLVIGFTGDNETNSYATIHGELVVKKNYGTYDPNVTTPPVVEQGAIYFRIIS